MKEEIPIEHATSQTTKYISSVPSVPYSVEDKIKLIADSKKIKLIKNICLLTVDLSSTFVTTIFSSKRDKRKGSFN